MIPAVNVFLLGVVMILLGANAWKWGSRAHKFCTGRRVEIPATEIELNKISGNMWDPAVSTLQPSHRNVRGPPKSGEADSANSEEIKPIYLKMGEPDE